MENTRVVYVANGQKGVGEQASQSTNGGGTDPCHQEPVPPEHNTVLSEPVQVAEGEPVSVPVSPVPEQEEQEPVQVAEGEPRTVSPAAAGGETRTVEVDEVNEVYESDNESEKYGGYVREVCSDDDSSICTEHILQVDPIYIKLSKFLETSEGDNVCNILQKILHQLEELNKNIAK
jgi:hypothetical protein